MKEKLSVIKIPSKSFSPITEYLEILYFKVSNFSSTLNQAPLPNPGNQVPFVKLNVSMFGNSVPIKLSSKLSFLKKVALYSFKIDLFLYS